jgi:hypothetical protein
MTQVFRGALQQVEIVATSSADSASAHAGARAELTKSTRLRLRLSARKKRFETSRVLHWRRDAFYV